LLHIQDIHDGDDIIAQYCIAQSSELCCGGGLAATLQSDQADGPTLFDNCAAMEHQSLFPHEKDAHHEAYEKASYIELTALLQWLYGDGVVFQQIISNLAHTHQHRFANRAILGSVDAMPRAGIVPDSAVADSQPCAFGSLTLRRLGGPQGQLQREFGLEHHSKG
jgi:hypothetical protein